MTFKTKDPGIDQAGRIGLMAVASGRNELVLQCFNYQHGFQGG